MPPKWRSSLCRFLTPVLPSGEARKILATPVLPGLCQKYEGAEPANRNSCGALELKHPTSIFFVVECRRCWQIYIQLQRYVIFTCFLQRNYFSGSMRAKDYNSIMQKGTQPSQTCSGGFINTQLCAIC